MKTRPALIYLAVLLLLAGYFYFFEVVRKEARVKEEEAARRLFQVDKTEITALKIEKLSAETISLKKNGHWLILEPLSTRADEFAVEGLLASLQSLEMDRQVDEAARDLQPYGLDKPALRYSFLVGDRWHHLRIGGRAVIGDKFYASGDQEDRVILIADSQQRSLDKTLFDLRDKELFSLKSEEVERIEVERPNKKLLLTREGQGWWQAPAAPNVKIKKSKVERVLDRLVWLRANRFLENEELNPAQLGLSPARVRVILSTPDDKETLLLGKTEKEEGTYAKAEKDPAIAMVSEGLIEELPDDLSDLEDRSFLTFKLDQVESIALNLEGKTAQLDRYNEEWKWAGENDRKNPETWLANSLLWKVQELEYEPGAPPQRHSPPEKTQLNIVLLAEDKQPLGTFRLGEVPPEGTKRGVLWFFKGSETAEPHWVSGGSLRGLHESVKKLVAPGA